MDLGLEKRVLGRLSSLQGQGIVRLLGDTSWFGRYGLVKEWVRGKTIGMEMMPNWRNLETNSNQQPTTDDIESARMLLSLFNTLDQVYERKVALGDFKLEDVIWDGQHATLIDFSQAGLAEYDSNTKEWRARNLANQKLEDYISQEDIPAILGIMFFPFTSLGNQEITGTGIKINKDSAGNAKNPILRYIAARTHRREYKNAEELKTHLRNYFITIGMNAQQLGISPPETSDVLRIEANDL